MNAASTGNPDNPRLRLELRSGRDAEGRHVTLALDRPYVIGGDASADVVVDDPSLLSRHARVAPGPGGAMLEPLAGALVTVNGATLSLATVLQDGDWLVLGNAA
jgi:hypothetical protein